MSLSEFQTFSTRETNPEYSLLDSAASVHVFHTKERFSNLRTSSRDKGLLCGTSYIPIEGWGDISLPLRIGNQTRLLVLKKAALVSDFPLNLVLLTCLEDQGYDWSHRSGEIQTKESRIIGTTVKSGNNFEIGNTGRFLATALPTLSTKTQDEIRTPEGSKPRQKISGNGSLLQLLLTPGTKGWAT